jgi:dihydrofolate reductase
MIRLIAAIDRKRGIAKHGYQPWYIPDDEAYFVKQSKSYGGNVLVGGTTFRDSFKSKPLTGRTTYLLTRNEQPINGVQLVHDLKPWLKSMGNQDVWVVGGASVYQQVIDAGLADELYITHIDADFGCDQFFPEYQPEFRVSSAGQPQTQNGFHFNYARYSR